MMITTTLTNEPEPVDTSYGHHAEYPHWPGTLHDCPACEAQMEDESDATA